MKQFFSLHCKVQSEFSNSLQLLVIFYPILKHLENVEVQNTFVLNLQNSIETCF